MKPTNPNAVPYGAFAFAAACFIIMAMAVAFVLGHDLVPNAPQALAKVGGASLLATGLMSALRV